LFLGRCFFHGRARRRFPSPVGGRCLSFGFLTTSWEPEDNEGWSTSINWMWLQNSPQSSHHIWLQHSSSENLVVSTVHIPFCWNCTKTYSMITTLVFVPSARLTLHSTKLCTKFEIFRKKIFFGTKVTSLCSSKWSDQECCKTWCVALKTSFQTRPQCELLEPIFLQDSNLQSEG
jgi:hypothetical protein